MKAYADPILGWGWYRRGYLRSRIMKSYLIVTLLLRSCAGNDSGRDCCLKRSRLAHMRPSLAITNRGHRVRAEVEGGYVNAEGVARGNDAKLQVRGFDVVDPSRKPVSLGGASSVKAEDQLAPSVPGG